jgi:hypothetical protein
MGLAAAIRTAVAAANAQTASLQVNVIHEAWIGFKDSDGTPDYATPVSRPALVQEGSTPHRRLPDGELITTRATVSFLGPVEPNGAEGRQEPIDPRDLFTLPSGLTGPLMEVSGVMIDPSTGRPFLSTFRLI